MSKAFRGERLGLRPTKQDGLWQAWYGRVCLGEFDMTESAVGRRVVRRRRVVRDESESATAA